MTSPTSPARIETSARTASGSPSCSPSPTARPSSPAPHSSSPTGGSCRRRRTRSRPPGGPGGGSRPGTSRSPGRRRADSSSRASTSCGAPRDPSTPTATPSTCPASTRRASRGRTVFASPSAMRNSFSSFTGSSVRQVSWINQSIPVSRYSDGESGVAARMPGRNCEGQSLSRAGEGQASSAIDCLTRLSWSVSHGSWSWRSESDRLMAGVLDPRLWRHVRPL